MFTLWKFTRWKLNRVEVRLAGARAALANEYEMARRTGTIYPVAINLLVREVAELTERQKQLTAQLTPRSAPTT